VAGEVPDPAPGSDAPRVISRRSGRLVVSVCVAVFVVLGAFVILLATRDTSPGVIIGSGIIGEQAPAFSGETLSGETFDLDDQRGRWVVVNFFASWCVGCIEEHPELVEFSQRHAAVGDAIVVSIAFDDSVGNVERFFAERGGDWPVLATDVGIVGPTYGVTALPETYLVAPNGRVVDKLVGASGVTADQLDATIARFEEPG
jgi:cytochrome c biogenesis protein CcmG/thiol:disulfide interchange protein DsbE